jgi:vesicle-fusing ATPase
MLTDVELVESFDSAIRVSAITTLKALDHVVREAELFRSDRELQAFRDIMDRAGMAGEGRLNVGVKKLLSLVEMARQDPDPVNRLAENLMSF